MFWQLQTPCICSLLAITRNALQFVSCHAMAHMLRFAISLHVPLHHEVLYLCMSSVLGPPTFSKFHTCHGTRCSLSAHAISHFSLPSTHNSRRARGARMGLKLEWTQGVAGPELHRGCPGQLPRPATRPQWKRVPSGATRSADHANSCSREDHTGKHNFITL